MVCYIHALVSLQSKTPGSATGDMSVGDSISELFLASRVFSTMQELEHWLDQSLALNGGGSLAGKFDTLIMCRMDVASRNLISGPDGQVLLLDWECAGFYPPELEIASLCEEGSCPSDLQFRDDLLEVLNANFKQEIVRLLGKVHEVDGGDRWGFMCLETSKSR